MGKVLMLHAGRSRHPAVEIAVRVVAVLFKRERRSLERDVALVMTAAVHVEHAVVEEMRAERGRARFALGEDAQFAVRADRHQHVRDAAVRSGRILDLAPALDQQLAIPRHEHLPGILDRQVAAARELEDARGRRRARTGRCANRSY